MQAGKTIFDAGVSGVQQMKINRLLLYAISLLIISISIYVRIRLLGTPLERDEGEYAYMAQLFLKGIPPYASAYTMKLPGVALVYALVMSIFGQSTVGIHIGLLLTNIACMGLVYLLGRRFLTRETAFSAAALYAILSLSPSVQGVFAHATHFVLLFSLSGIILLEWGLTTRQARTLFMAGICFGLAFLMKQHAAAMFVFAIIFQIWPRRKSRCGFIKECCTFLIGAAAPYIILVIWLVNAGVFDSFWFWTVQYASEYAAGLSFTEGVDNFVQQLSAIAGQNLPIWLLASAGIFFLIANKDININDRMFLIGLLAVSFAMICPGFHFRPHYFVLLLPPVSLLAAYMLGSVPQFGILSSYRFRAALPPLLLAAAAVYSFSEAKDYSFTNTPQEVSRMTYGANPFPEAVEIAAYLREHTTSNDRIAILGSEPEILFHADRLSATGHIYMYGLMEPHRYAEKMQRQLIGEIESGAPAYLVVVHTYASWLLRPNSLNRILDWGDRYISERYEEVCIVDIPGSEPTRYILGKELAGYEPVSDSFVSIFRRR